MVEPTVAVLMAVGLQVPVMAGVLVDLNGKTGDVLPAQSGPIGAKAGVTGLVITMVMRTGPEH